jgi:hypothetical protein
VLLAGWLASPAATLPHFPPVPLLLQSESCVHTHAALSVQGVPPLTLQPPREQE